MIVTDIDGTFLKSDRTLHEENVRAVRELIANGHAFALATGRIFGTARIIPHKMGLDVYIISNNGAGIRHTAEAEALYTRTMPKELLERIFEVAERHSYGYQVYTEMSMVTATPNPFLEKYIEENGDLPDALKYEVDMYGDPRAVEGVRKVAYTFYRKEPTAELLRDLRMIPGVSAAQSHRFGIDISLADVNKGAALLKLAEYLGIAPENTVAFGDEDNDEGMLRAAGIGIAMKNATERTRAAADFVTGTNDEAGFAHALRRLNLIGADQRV